VSATPEFWPTVLSLFTSRDEPRPAPSAFWRLFTDDSLLAANKEPLPTACEFNKDYFFWTLRDLPVKEAVQHMAIIGTTGSGKTTLIRLLLQSIAPRFRNNSKGPPEQLIVFDAKTEIVPLLNGLGLTDSTTDFHLLNPYDKRGIAWTIAEGVQEPAMALNLASIIVPEEPASTAPFFANGARNLVFAAILGLNQSLGLTWTLRDLIFALDSKARLRAVTADHDRASAIVQRTFEDQLHADGILSHVGTRLVHFEPLAALWHTTLLSTRFTIAHFLKNPGVLILGGDPTLHEILRPLNALLLKAISQQIIRGPNSGTPRIWVILDEFPAMGKVECMAEFLRMGRSKGAAILLGAQHVESLQALYGEHGANDLLGLCTYKTFLRAGAFPTAQWAAHHFDSVRREETTFSESWGKNGFNYSRNYDFRDRQVFLPSVFLNLPIPRPGKPFIAIHDVPSLDTSVISCRASESLFSMLVPPTDADALEPRSNVRDQTLAKWTEGEESLITKINGQGKASSEKPAAKEPNEESVKPPDPTKHAQRKKDLRGKSGGKSSSKRTPHNPDAS